MRFWLNAIYEQLLFVHMLSSIIFNMPFESHAIQSIQMNWNRVEWSRSSRNSNYILFRIDWELRNHIESYWENLINFSLFLFCLFRRLGPCELPLSDQWLSHTSASHLSQQTINSALLSPRVIINNNNLSTNNNNTTNNNNNFNIQQQVSSIFLIACFVFFVFCLFRFWIIVKLDNLYCRHKCNKRRTINKSIRIYRIRRK